MGEREKLESEIRGEGGRKRFMERRGEEIEKKESEIRWDK